jgi:hypothetical protein
MWFILISLKDNVSGVRNAVCRRRCLRITHNNKVHLDETEWICLTHLTSCCLNTQLHELNILYFELKQWQDNVNNCKELCTPKSTNLIDYETLYDELFCKKY